MGGDFWGQKILNLTKHFTLEEFERSQTAMRHGIDNSVPEHLMPNIHRMAQLMEYIRYTLYNNYIQITSGYRCEELEIKISGRAYGAHMQALACDFVCPRFGSPLSVATAIRDSGVAFDQLIWEGNWVHIGLAPGALRRQILTAKFPKGVAVYTIGLNP